MFLATGSTTRGRGPTLKEEIVQLVSKRPGLTDREITVRLRGRHAIQQPVNHTCRQLEAAGVLKRSRRHDGLIGNYPTDREAPDRAPPPSTSRKVSHSGTATERLSEDEVKEILVAWLEKEGWSVKVAWGKARGVDCVAIKDKDRWIIEVKGCGSRQPVRVNYFLAILGETLQRMDDPRAHYSIALPDMAQCRGLWERLPDLAKERTKLTALFVRADGQVRIEK